MTAPQDTQPGVPPQEASSRDAAAAANGEAARRRRMRISTAVFAIATMLSRVFGYVRTAVVAAVFGQTAQVSAFAIAFQIPNLIRSLVADSALGASLVPVVSDLRERDQEERAWRVASTICGLILVVLGPLCVLCMIFAPLIVDPFVGHSFTPAEYQLTVDLTRILMPLVLIMALSGVVVGLLNAYDHFSSPALAPVAWNAVILIGLVLAATAFPAQERIYVYTVATLAGTIVQAVLPVPWLRGLPGRLRLALDWRDPRVREVLRLMLPVTIGLGLINLQQLVGTAFSTRVPAETLGAGVDDAAGAAIIENAFRVYMLPQGVFSVAVSTVFFPALARFASRGDQEGFRRTFADGLRQIFVLLVPSAVFLAVLAEPTVRLLYERGNFQSADTRIVAATLVALSAGLVLNGASLLLIRSFFSLRQPWMPTAVSLLTLVVNVVAIALTYRPFGVVGIAAATSLVNVVSFAVLYVVLQHRVGLLGTRRTLRTLALCTMAAAVAIGAAWAVWRRLDESLGHDAVLAQIASLGAATVVAAAVYLGIIIRLQLVDRRLFSRRARATPPEDTSSEEAPR